MHIKCAHFARYPLNCLIDYPSSKVTSKIDVMMFISILLELYSKIHC